MENKNTSTTTILVFILTMAIIAPVLNTYLLESIFFPRNTFHFLFILLYTFVEVVFLVFSIHLMVAFLGMRWLYKAAVSKKELQDETGFDKPSKYAKLIIPAIFIYGLGSGILVRFMVSDYSLLQCLGWMLALSFFWGSLFRYYWNKGRLLWVYNWIHTENVDQP